jgi:hypothetical protein
VRDVPLVGQLPQDQVLDPRQCERFQRAADPDAGVEGDVAEAVGGERDVVADDGADDVDMGRQVVDALRGDLDAGERMHRRQVCAGTRLRNQRPRHVPQQVDAPSIFSIVNPRCLRSSSRAPIACGSGSDGVSA